MKPLTSEAIADGLGPDEAFVVLEIETDIALDKIVLYGLVIEEEIQPGRHFWISRVSPGRYRWRTLHVAAPNWFKGIYRIKRHRYAWPEELDFEVAAGRLNYVGTLRVEKGKPFPARPSLFIRVQNRSAEVLRRLAREHEDLIDRYPLSTGSISGDRFLEFYSETRRRLREATDDLPRAVPDEGSP
ncbi:MAG: hypothetical protein AAGC67_05110 [Myxococcota bacterium]